MKTSTKKKKSLKIAFGIAALFLVLNQTTVAQCDASFTYTTSSSSISATASTGTTSSVDYIWSLTNSSGQNIGGSGGAYTSWAPLYNGTYTVSLTIDSASGTPSTCTSAQTITISGGTNQPPCTAGFTYTLGTNGLVMCTNTSPSDPFGNTSYSWNWGTSSTNTYYYNGTYTITLSASNSVDGCSTSSSQTVVITNATGGTLPPCNSNFTYTIGVGGQVSFTSLSTDTTYTGNSIYNWVFEPGQGSNLKNPTYTYPYNGVYSVSLNITDSIANCYSSTTQTISITNTANPPCAPTVSFYMHKDSLNPLPGVWEISPSYSSQVSSAVWFWGDGTYTAGLYPTHTYSVAGQYSVCVKVYSSCGDSSTTCQNDSLYRLAQNNSTNSVIQITVINATAGIKTNAHETAQVSVYPNPSAGLFTLQLSNVSANASKAQISITNILGEVIYTSQEQITNSTLAKNIDLQNIPNGAYFMKVTIGDKTFTNKTIISK